MKTRLVLLLFLSLVSTTIFSQEKLDQTLLRIKQNCTRIDAIKKWSQTKEVLNYKYLEGDTKATLFYNNNKLEKIKVTCFREEFNVKIETKYYFLNNELSFVIDTFTEYTQPNQSKKAKTQTDKLYFANKELVHLIMQQDSGWDMPSEKEVYELHQEEIDKILNAK